MTPERVLPILDIMNPFYRIYTILCTGTFLSIILPFLIYTRLSRHHQEGLKERLGFISKNKIKRNSGTPCIWMHAVSLGEVKVAETIIKAFKHIMPESQIILSTTTKHAHDLAIKTFNEQISVIYAPVDLVYAVKKALAFIRPDVMVFVETEIWPAWIMESCKMGIKVAFVNGRISVRSIKTFRKLRFFFKTIFKHVAAFSMITDEDAIRIKDIGAEQEKIVINGNAKYDLLFDLADPDIEIEMRQILDIESSETVLIAGSTRKGEENIVMDAYVEILSKFPDLILIIAPRHIERANDIESLLKGRGFNCQFRSKLSTNSKRKEQILILDTFGELFKVYSLGHIVFCGASLVPLGGQNPMEAAVWENAILYGPFMDDFKDAKALLEKKNAGIEINNSGMLAEKIIMLLNNRKILKEYRVRARAAVMDNLNSAENHAKVIAKLL